MIQLDRRGDPVDERIAVLRVLDREREDVLEPPGPELAEEEEPAPEGAGQPGAGPEGATGGRADDVVDAEFEEVKDKGAGKA